MLAFGSRSSRRPALSRGLVEEVLVVHIRRFTPGHGNVFFAVAFEDPDHIAGDLDNLVRPLVRRGKGAHVQLAFAYEHITPVGSNVDQGRG